MKVKGINYDVGTKYTPGFITRKDLDKEAIQKEIRIIKAQLNCNAIRLYGERLDKLIGCSKIAFENNLEVWFSPRFIDRTQGETLKLIEKCAKEAEKLRKTNPKVTFTVGNEFTLDTKGFLEGETHDRRIQSLVKGQTRNSNKQLNQFLKRLVPLVRKFFKGEITYASGFWEQVNWNILDIVGVNKYLTKWNKEKYVYQLQELKKIGKPVAITEFGCGSYIGAADKGPIGHEIINWEKHEIKGNYRRSEKEQANYIKYLLELFEKEDLFAAFVYTFIEPLYLYSENPKRDLDKASYNVVRVYPDGRIKPKESFKVISKYYKAH